LKKGIENIDEILKNAFDGFESDVDPSVWNNVQNSISTNTPNPQPDTSSVISNSIAKSTLLKVAAGVALISATAGSIYYLNTSNKTEITKTNTEQTSNNTTVKEVSIKAEETSTHSIENNIDSDLNIKKETISPKAKVEAIKEVEQQIVQPKKEEKPENLNETTSATNQPTPSKVVEPKKETTVKKTSKLVAKIIANQTKGTAPLDVEFNIEGNGIAYQWDFDDNSPVSGERNPYHTFENEGIYQVALTTIDKDANSKTDYLTIEVKKNITSSLNKIPNVFSPNGDGHNDVLRIEGNDIKEFKAVVLDSKGKPVFEWNSIEGFWDGRDYGNNLLPKGTYFLSIIATGNDGEKYTPKKTIQLR